jgi:hypothetical protein
MKVYLDQSVIEEWINFQLEVRLCKGYTKDVIENLNAMVIILERASELCIEFIISSLNYLEKSSRKENSFEEFVRKYNVKKVSAVGIRPCMFDQYNGLPGDNLMMIGKAQASGGRKIVSTKIKDAKHLKKIMRRFRDPIHVDSAIEAGADFLLTMDGNLIRNNVLSDRLCNEKFQLISPKDFCNKYFSK